MKKIKRVDYSALPTDFWDKVVFYDFFITFSGFIEIDPYITIWTMEGEEYYINTNELRDGRFERVIPFFELMTYKEAAKRKCYFYFDWKLCPDGWNYYYNQSSHCFIPTPVHEVFLKSMEQYQNERKEKTTDGRDSVEEMFMWRILLKQAYKGALGIVINEEVSNYIRFDELIHVYEVRHDYKRLHIDQIPEEDVIRMKQADVWSIRYTTDMDNKHSSIEIVIYFEKTQPYLMSYDFRRKEYSNFIDEHEFMEKFSEMMQFDFGGQYGGHSLHTAPKGYTVLSENDFKIYWIRDDIYRSHYKNVIEPLLNDSENGGYIMGTPICGCGENKEGYLES